MSFASLIRSSRADRNGGVMCSSFASSFVSVGVPIAMLVLRLSGADRFAGLTDPLANGDCDTS